MSPEVAAIEKFLAGLLAIIEAQKQALVRIAAMPEEDDEWDAADKYAECRNIAARALL